MENIAQKIKALNYSEEMMAILPKFLGTLAAKNPETGEDLVTEQEIVQILSYLKEKGISLRPSQIKVLANGFSYIQKAVEEMDRIGELKMYVDDPSRMTSKDNVNRIIYLRDRKVEYKSPEGKYSKLAFSKKAFEAEYGIIDFAAEKAKREQAAQAPEHPVAPKADDVKKAEAHREDPVKSDSKAQAKTEEKSPVKVEGKTVVKTEEPKKDPVLQELIQTVIEEDKARVAQKAESKVEAKQAPKADNHNAPARPEGKKEINPEPVKKNAEDLDATKVDIKIPVLEEPKPEKLNVDSNRSEKPQMSNAPAKPKAEAPKKTPAPEAKKSEEQKENKPRDIKPVPPVNPQNKNNEPKAIKADIPVSNKGEEKVNAVVTKDESIEYTGELDLASLEASFNDTKPSQKEDELVKGTVVNMVEGPINVYNTPYDEILSKPQTIALTDETFERYENLSDSIRRVLTTVYNIAEITDNITDNLIKLITAGVASDSEVMYYAITYGKNISEEEAQHLKASIEEELEYIKIFDLDTEGQGRAA